MTAPLRSLQLRRRKFAVPHPRLLNNDGAPISSDPMETTPFVAFRVAKLESREAVQSMFSKRESVRS